MPNYDYECQDCGHRFEVFQRMSEPKLEDCPQDACGGRVRRLLGTGAGVIFKGSGFYETDYRSKSYQDGQKGDKAPAKTSEPKKSKEGGGKASKPGGE